MLVGSVRLAVGVAPRTLRNACGVVLVRAMSAFPVETAHWYLLTQSTSMLGGIKDKNALLAGQVETAMFPEATQQEMKARGRQKAISLIRGSP